MAAQAVQQSGHPTAYQQWEDQAEVLAGAFTGAEPALVSCSFPEPTVAATPAKVLQLLGLELPHTRLAASTQAGELRPVAAWATVGWLVAKADRLGIEAVRTPVAGGPGRTAGGWTRPPRRTGSASRSPRSRRPRSPARIRAAIRASYGKH